MLLVVADTSPVGYLVQIGQIDLLARQFAEIRVPSTVARELQHPSAPAAVRTWIQGLPEWVRILTAPESDDPTLASLDPGERAAIALGLSLKADLILIDERKGAAVALTKGFEVTGTLGVLDLAASRGESAGRVGPIDPDEFPVPSCAHRYSFSETAGVGVGVNHLQAHPKLGVEILDDTSRPSGAVQLGSVRLVSGAMGPCPSVHRPDSVMRGLMALDSG